MLRRTLVVPVLLSAASIAGAWACVARRGPDVRVTPGASPSAVASSSATPNPNKPWAALLASNGELTISHSGEPVAKLTPELFDDNWQRRSAGALGDLGAEHSVARSSITAPDGTRVASAVGWKATDHGVALSYSLTPEKAVKLNSLDVAVEVPIDSIAGKSYAIDGEHGEVPAHFSGKVHLADKDARSVELHLDAGTLRVAFPESTHVIVQDNRQWGPSLVVRMGTQKGEWSAGSSLHVAVELAAEGGWSVDKDMPVTIGEGPEWVRLPVELDIEKGSALDFSALRPTRAPAGSGGRVIATPDGHFALEGEPKTSLRFYGINLCFGAQYLPHPDADRLAERLARLGYNALRIHHYEGKLVASGAKDSLTFDAQALDQLDYLVAALKKQGIYVTTDLFVSRPVRAAEIWPGATGNAGMNEFKMAVPVNARAWANWKAFAKKLLEHKNPYAGLRWADDPVLGWLSMINEGTFANYFAHLDDRVKADWTAKYNGWLKHTYKTKDALAKAWGSDPGGDPVAGTVPLEGNVWADAPRDRDLVAFSAEVETEMFAKMQHFLRDEVRTKALLTNTNAWTNRIATQTSRTAYDYVDDHFYVDHPQFIEKDWQLPSKSPNTSPIADGAPGGRNNAFVRVFGKPFTVSEYNYSSPGRFRGVGGILTGALAAIQDWDAVWRFAYSHDPRDVFAPAPINYFDVAADPLNQAAERASVALFLRGDMKRAAHAVAVAMTPSEVRETRKSNHDIAPEWQALAWSFRVGTVMRDAPGAVSTDLLVPLGWTARRSSWSGAGAVVDVDPYGKDASDAVLGAIRHQGWFDGNRTDLTKKVFVSDGGELTIDATRDEMVLDTPRTAGGYAPAGRTIETSSATIRIVKTDATVWISSLDGQPISQSRRLLITHLTDLQNSGARFAESARQTLLEWGRLPHLVRAGTAGVVLRHANAARAKVFALSTSGRRLAPVEARASATQLDVPLDVTGGEGARMLYEVVIE